MSTYDSFRHFADSWMLLAMFLFFIGMIIRTYLPRFREWHKDAAESIFRHENAPAPDREEA